jgi:hypothetical protein
MHLGTCFSQILEHLESLSRIKISDIEPAEQYTCFARSSVPNAIVNKYSYLFHATPRTIPAHMGAKMYNSMSMADFNPEGKSEEDTL